MDRFKRCASAPLVAMCFSVGACNDGRAPSDAAFRKALEPIVADGFCQSIPGTRMVLEGQAESAAFPLTVATSAAPGAFYDRDYDKSSVEMLDAATNSGLLTRTEGEHPVRPLNSSAAALRRPTATYAPTKAGAAYFRAVERKTYGGSMMPFPEICGARGELTDVVRWSEPADFGGRRVSQVTYRYKGVDPIPLATPAEAATVAEPKERTVPMVLESDGWRVLPR